MSLLLILLLAGLMSAARSFAVSGLPHSVSAGLAFGYVLLTAFFAGRIFKQLHLPRLTGYIAAGIVVGPAVLDLLSEGMTEQLTLVNGVAISLIALTAGNELDLRAFRPLLRTVAWLSLTAVVGTAVLLAVAIWLCRGLLPFMETMSLTQSVATALVLGSVMAAQSPAVVVALRDEMEADGPVTRTVLGVVVIADLVVVLLFALTSSIAKAVFGAPGDVGDTLAALTWELLGSLVVGTMVGALITLYLKKVKAGGALFILTVALVMAEVGRRVHFDPLLLALAAGMFIRNLSTAGDRLHHEIEAASLPVYVVFFAVAGATIHLDVLLLVGIPAGIMVLTRAAGLLVGSRVGATLAQAPPEVVRWSGFGLLPQAGLALALSLLFAQTFPEFGAEAAALTLGVVAINEILAPAIYRYALVRSGEAGRLHRDEEQEPPALPEPAETPG